MAQENRIKSYRTRVRIPVTAGYAFQLISQFVPLSLPLDIKTGKYGVGTDEASGRFMVSCVRLRFKAMTLMALVRSWEPIGVTGVKKKSLQHLEIRYKSRAVLPFPAWLETFKSSRNEESAMARLTPSTEGAERRLEFGLTELNELCPPIYV